MNKPTMSKELMATHNEIDSLTLTVMDMELDSLKADYIAKHGDLSERTALYDDNASREAIAYRREREAIKDKYDDMLFKSWKTHDIA